MSAFFWTQAGIVLTVGVIGVVMFVYFLRNQP